MSFLHTMRMLAPPPKYWPKWMHKKWIDRDFKRVFGHPVNWKDPKTFNEKISWYMVNFTDPVATRISDKISFKDYVQEKLGEGYTAKLLAVWDRAEDIDFSNLTPPYVLKSNCSCDDNNIRFVLDAISDPEKLKSDLAKSFFKKNTLVNGKNRAYWDVKPCVFAEEYLGSGDGFSIDYKFYCFNGEPYCIYTDVRPRQFAFYDTEWNVLDVRYKGDAYLPIEKPEHLAEMLTAARKLSQGFPFVRVDLYDMSDGFRVGEMTLADSWGLQPFEPESFDYEMGKRFILPKKFLI